MLFSSAGGFYKLTKMKAQKSSIDRETTETVKGFSCCFEATRNFFHIHCLHCLCCFIIFPHLTWYILYQSTHIYIYTSIWPSKKKTVFSREVGMFFFSPPFFCCDTLPETNIFAPENGWLEDFLVSFWGFGLFSGAKWLLVSGRVPALPIHPSNIIQPKGLVVNQITFLLRCATNDAGDLPRLKNETINSEFFYPKNGWLEDEDLYPP